MNADKKLRADAPDLQCELACYLEHEAEMLEKHSGEYVLIKDENVIGFYTTRAEAMAEGYKAYLNQPFFAHLIRRNFASPVFSRAERQK